MNVYDEAHVQHFRLLKAHEQYKCRKLVYVKHLWLSKVMLQCYNVSSRIEEIILIWKLSTIKCYDYSFSNPEKYVGQRCSNSNSVYCIHELATYVEC